MYASDICITSRVKYLSTNEDIWCVHMPLNVHQDIERYASACRYIKADTSKMWTECTWSTFTVISLYIAQHIQCMPRNVHTHAPLNLHQDIQRYVSTKEDVWCIEMPLNADQDIQRYGSRCTMHVAALGVEYMYKSRVHVQVMYKSKYPQTNVQDEKSFWTLHQICENALTCMHFIYIWMSHVTHMNESCHTHEWVMSHTYEWVMSHMWMSHVTHMNESCHTY